MRCIVVISESSSNVGGVAGKVSSAESTKNSSWWPVLSESNTVIAVSGPVPLAWSIALGKADPVHTTFQ